MRLVELDKAHGVLPVVIGEIIHHLLYKCNLLVTCAMKTEACVNLNLYAGLGSGIEGDVNITLEEYITARCPLAVDQALLGGGAARGGKGGGYVNERRIGGRLWG